jgi:hypothetical protein
MPAAPRPLRADLVLTALALCVLAGAELAAFFDAKAPYRAISEWLLAQRVVVFTRNLHYWSAQALFVFGLLYFWHRLRAATAGRAMARFRLLPLVPLLGIAMLSGFVLRGDSDAHEVLRVVAAAADELPFGSALAAALRAAALQPRSAYALHLAAAALTVAVLVFGILRRPWPRARVVAAFAAAVGVFSLFVSPGLHDGLAPTLHGPWYFLGLQQLLPHVPAATAAALLTVLLAPWWLPHVRAPWSARALSAMGLMALGYVLLCAFAQFTRVEDGSVRLHWPASRGDLQAGWILRAPPPQAGAVATAVVRGRAEGCRACHTDVGGFDRSHRPATVGCAACHGGDPFTLDAARAHRDLVRVPGNLADARTTCGQSGCHVAIAPRVERSIMTTMAGVITANRRVLGEPVDPAALPPQADHLGHSVADSHLRELCVSCHLGQPKTEWGAIGQESRGGGCNACHLVYGKDAAAELARYLALEPGLRSAIPRTHPGLTSNPTNEHCFGCHSRSSRISTSYEGWHELNHAPRDGIDPARLRKLDDGRTFERVVPDVHHERGLDCIDCHTSNEVMGSGAVAARKSDQLRIACTDCHADRLASIDPTTMDPETRTLLALRDWTLTPSQRIGAATGGEPLVNVIVGGDGRGQLRRKRTGELLPLKPPLPVCAGNGGHRRLSCASCHSAWASHCTSCHTAFDPNDVGYDNLDHAWVRGTWNETAGPFEAAPPTLGVHTGRGAAGHIETFVPGMILTFDRNRDPGRPPDLIFRRLYGLTFAHTIRREARSCRSCHNDPVALGYGRGMLRYEIDRSVGRWRFAPEQPPSPQDGLPADAWIGFLQSRTGMVSTRDDVRPFSVDEQKRILRVGACLNCHAEDSAVMRRALADFETALAQRSRRCALPTWP